VIWIGVESKLGRQIVIPLNRGSRHTEVNFTGILRVAFLPVSFGQTVTTEKVHKTLLYRKVIQKMLMKLIPRNGFKTMNLEPTQTLPKPQKWKTLIINKT